MPRKRPSASHSPEPTELRIIGGRFRGRKLAYQPFAHGGSRVARPMKERTRESIFNLISTASAGRHAVDLFAGTGALGLEALSRGAVGCTFIEKHVPTARVVEQNIATLGVGEQTDLLMTSAFLWGRRDLPSAADTPPKALPWLIFCSPPYAFYVDREDDMLALLSALVKHSPDDSVMIVEADERFDFTKLPFGAGAGEKKAAWDVRSYRPAVVGVWRKGERAEAGKGGSGKGGKRG